MSKTGERLIAVENGEACPQCLRRTARGVANRSRERLWCDFVSSQGCRSAELWRVALDDFRRQVGDTLSDNRLRQVARGTNPVDRADELAVVG